jgi:hypothetical protein
MLHPTKDRCHLMLINVPMELLEKCGKKKPWLVTLKGKINMI